MKSQLIHETCCMLGEGICWDSFTNQFFWVDIHGRRVWAASHDGGPCAEWHSPQRIGWLVRQAGDQRWIAGLQEGMAYVKLLSEGQVFVEEWLARPFDGRASMRFNDAKADVMGRIWAGSLNNDDESRPDGELFCLDGLGRLTVFDRGYGVANGPALHPSGRWMLHTDSACKTIYAFDLSDQEGAINKRIWKVLAPDEGYPDGMNFDQEGHLWLAHWGAGCVSRYAADGTLLDRVSIPASNVTNIAFGGPDLDRLWVTTARAGLTDEQLAQQPLAGSVFEVMGHNTRGLSPMPRVRQA